MVNSLIGGSNGLEANLYIKSSSYLSSLTQIKGALKPLIKLEPAAIRSQCPSFEFYGFHSIMYWYNALVQVEATTSQASIFLLRFLTQVMKAVSNPLCFPRTLQESSTFSHPSPVSHLLTSEGAEPGSEPLYKVSGTMAIRHQLWH